MDDNFIAIWAPHPGWESARAQAFWQSRANWAPDKLIDDDIDATVDDVGLEIYERRHTNPVVYPGAYLRTVVAKRLYDTYEGTLDPYERAAWRAKKRAREGLARHPDDDGSQAHVVHPDDHPDDFGTRLVRYDDEGVGEIPDASGEDAIEGVVELDALQRRLAAAIVAVHTWTRTAKGRTETVATIARIAIRTLTLLATDPDALRVWADPKGGPRLVVRAAMGDVDPERWGGPGGYEPVSRHSVLPVVWQELYGRGRYCERALELLCEVLGGDEGGGGVA